MKVLLVTSWGTSCGIACHSANLKSAVEQADPSIVVIPSEAHLDPGIIPLQGVESAQIIHLNWHRALHSRWSPLHIGYLQGLGYQVVITFHDTYGELPPDDLSVALCDKADAFIVHEPCLDLPKAIYWRMGVPENLGYVGELPSFRRAHPVLGTVGHDFPWKGWEMLARITHELGWGLLICTPAMTSEREAELALLNPRLAIRRDYASPMVIGELQACDATAFTFVCGNSGQSASMLLGIAAKKPVLAFSACRQMRSLYADPLGRAEICWCDDEEDLRGYLLTVPLERLDPGICALAEQDGWPKLGQKFAALYRSLVA